ncbi:sporulation protein [Zooshikella marina]|uniref:sporulation protein n=1 Tax=Zooshikella ganghwensis TaxID=202772 RepID=UPI001BAE79F3|nr:sporulation protein [Zooshikella ganghwensis]MBU2706542.1 sporulation protein [Zooshikella ganghwensis]
MALLLDGQSCSGMIAGVQVLLKTDKQVYCQGETVNGKVMVKGGAHLQKAQQLNLTLQEYWVDIKPENGVFQRRALRKRRDEMTIANHFEIRPHDETAFDFSFRLPENCRLSGQNEGWCLYFQADIPLALDPVMVLHLPVMAVEPINYIIRACEFYLQMELLSSLYIPVDDNNPRGGMQMAYKFRMPTNMSGRLDCIFLLMRQDGCRGVSVIFRKFISDSESCKLFLNDESTDNKTVRYVFTCEELFNSSGMPDLNNIASLVASQIRQNFL